jgi:hypothetical protein
VAPSTRLPSRVHLPSGRVARLDDAAARAAASIASAAEGPCLRDLGVLGGAGVLRDEQGAPLDPLDLPLRDAHVLRALLAHARVVPEEEADFDCENCGEPFRVAPSWGLEPAPFVDGELDHAELDAPFDHDRAHPIPALRVGREVARSVRLAPRTAREALPLLRAAGAPELRITPAIATAMGVVALGRERRASRLADALARAPDAAWQAVVDLVLQASYPPRLVAVHRCAACGARNDLDVPLERELGREPRAPIGGAGRAMPDLDAFEAKVRAAADRIYRDRGVRNVDLFVDAGVPLCDDGGEPLLGCYTPGGSDADLGVERAPEIRIFYRTFQSEFSRDPSFDLDAEIRETIDHELSHHLHQLAGFDPMDEEEHAEIDREEAARVGRAEARRRAGRSALGDLVGFLRVTWPVLVVAAVASALAYCAGVEGPF